LLWVLGAGLSAWAIARWN